MLLGSRDRGEVCREVFQGLSRAGINAHLEQSVTILVRRALNRHRQFRFFPSSVKRSVPTGSGLNGNIRTVKTSFSGGAISR